MHGLGDNCDGYVEGDQTDHDGQPEQERDDPVLVVAMYDYTGNPPSDLVSPNA